MTDDTLIQHAIDLIHTTTHSTYESVVIFGASFNPITLGHLALIQVLLHDPLIKDQRIYLIPARQSPLKPPEMYACAVDRLNMLTLAVDHYFKPADRERLSIQTVEIDRLEPSRMSVTLALLTIRHQARQRYTVVCGYDHLACFNQWYQWESFKDLCTLIFYPREGVSVLDTTSMTALHQLLQAGINVTIVCADKAEMAAGQAYCQHNMRDSIQQVQWVYNPQAQITLSCATDIRAYYQQQGSNVKMATPVGITEEVHDYILKHGCYR